MDIARIPHRLVIAAAALQLAACSNLSGLGGGSEFNCKAPEGIPCQSISGVHHNERAGNLPAQRAALGRPAGKADAGGGVAASQAAPRHGEGGPLQADATAVAPPTPLYRRDVSTRADAAAPVLGAIRSEPTVIRIWVAPWEDADGDLNDQSYVYLQIDSGRWLIEHNRAQIRRQFAPQRAPSVAVGGVVEPSEPRSGTGATVSAAPGQPAAAKTLTKEEAIALGRAQAQALSANKPAPTPEARR